MSNWKYVGFDKQRKKVVGQLEANSEREVRKVLRAQGIRPKEITPPSILEMDLGMWMVDNGFASAFSKTELLSFTRQLAVMFDAGVPIMQCLEILYKSQKNLNLKKVVKQISEEVGNGKSLSEAMSGKRGFDNLYVNLVRAGESGGVLDQILFKITEFMEKQERTKKQIKSAMTYPAVVLVVGFAVVYALMVFVIPKLKEMLTDTGQQLPEITQMVIDTSNFLSENYLTILLGVIVGGVMISKVVKTKEGKPFFDRLMMNLPIFGEIVVKGNMSSFTRTLATMLSSGVTLVDSLEICINTIDNSVISKDLQKVRSAVTEGKTLTEPLSNISYFPPMVTQMVKVGEQTGQLDTMLTKVANIFEEEVDTLVAGMSKMIEPFIIVVLGGIVATILVAMYLPIFQSAQGI